MKRFTWLLTCFFISMCLAIAQNKQITGIVMDENNDPAIGVSVIVKGTSLGTVTGMDGTFSFSVPQNATSLVFKYLGYRDKEVTITPNMTVTMTLDSQALDEVMVVAYGTAKKSSFTGAAEVIRAEAIEKRSVSDLSKALEGTVAGLQSTSGGGQPGSEASIMIRGIGSIHAASTPLYVVDGTPYDGDISALNPNDIESVTVLKDASSGALFGARGANGVILITTKKGKAGKTDINLKASWGVISRAIPDYETVNSASFMELAWESTRNQYLYGRNPQPLETANALASANFMGLYGGEIYNPFNIASSQLIDPATGKINPNAKLKYSDNWMKEPENDTPIRQEYLLSISDGTEKHRYLLSLGYLDENGLLKNSNFSRFSGRLNIDSDITDYLKGGMNVGFSQTKQQSLYGESSAYSNVWHTALNMAPIYPVYIRDTNGNYVLDSQGKKQFDYGTTRPYANDFNVIATLFDDKQTKEMDNMNTHLFAELGDKNNESLGFLKDFKLQVNLNADYRNRNEMLYWNPEFGNAKNVQGLLNRENNRLLSYTFNQLLYYQKKVNLHNFDVMAGHEFYSRKYTFLSGERQTFPFSGLYELGAGAVINDADSNTDRYYVEAYLSRLNYDYADKYYFSGSFRRDASSRFHPDHRWGTFWSLGGAWRISEEGFLSGNEWLDNLTFKAAYGVQGNDYLRELIDDIYYQMYYPWQGVYDLSYPNANLSGAWLKSIQNEDISWEKSHNFNIGLEGRFLKNRLWTTIEYFHRKTKDMLLEKTLPLSSGFTGYPANVGNVVNRGVDITIGGRIINQNSFIWDMTLVGTHFKNEVTKLNYDGQQIIEGNRITTVGHPIDSWYLPKSAGVDPLTGNQLYWYEDDNGEMAITDSYTIGTANRFIQGSRIPDFYGSLTNNFTIGDFDVSLLTTFSIGGKEYDVVYANLMGMRDAGNNWHKNMERRWQKPGDITDVPRLQLGNINAATDQYLINASYFAIKNVTVGYTLPASLLNKINISQIRIFAVGDNLYTFSHFKGLDPQNSFYGGQSYSYVPVRNISFGIDIKF
ncbi:MAG: TonB-dependent receptor [Bacteroidales bacterium]|nr:TonB-dependent receptor [Bacteroidales bacterium]